MQTADAYCMCDAWTLKQFSLDLKTEQSVEPESGIKEFHSCSVFRKLPFSQLFAILWFSQLVYDRGGRNMGECDKSPVSWRWSYTALILQEHELRAPNAIRTFD